MKFLKYAIALFGLCMFAQPASAEGHTAIARAQTLSRLQGEIGKECPFYSMWRSRCRELHLLVGELYRDPNFATKHDLDVLDRMAKLGTEVSGSRHDLAQAIAATKTLWAHAVIDHGDGELGVWEQVTCTPSQS